MAPGPAAQGVSREQTGDFQGARAALERALALGHADEGRARAVLASVLKELGEPAAAAKQARRALALPLKKSLRTWAQRILDECEAKPKRRR